MSTTNKKPNCEQVTLEAIKDNIHSVVLNKDKNTVEFVLKHCKLLGIDYDEQSVKLKFDLEATNNDKQSHLPETVDEDNMQSKLKILQRSSNESIETKEKEKDTNTKTSNKSTTKSTNKTDTKKHSNKKQTNIPKQNKTKPKTVKKKRSSKKTKDSNTNKGLNIIEESKEATDKSKPVMNSDKETQKTKKRKGKKHLRHRSKTTDDIETYSIQAHDKWSYFSTELTAKQLIRCQGFADIKCRYKYALELKFGSKLRREDVMEFKVPINTQVIRAYVVEDCLADGTNGEIVKAQGGIGKKFVRLFVKSQMDKGVDMKLHVWYK